MEVGTLPGVLIAVIANLKTHNLGINILTLFFDVINEKVIINTTRSFVCSSNKKPVYLRIGRLYFF